MSGWLEFLVVLITAGILLARQARGTIWLVVGGIYLLAWTFVRDGQTLALLLGWLAWGGLALMTWKPELRRQLLTQPLFRAFKRTLPEMSATERDALEAGTVWWDGELFSGRPDWSRLFRIPESRLNAAEQAFIDGPVDELCAMLDDWRITHEDIDLPPEVWDFIKARGFFGMIIPGQYGGLDFSARAHSEIVMRIAARSLTAAVTVMVPNSLGPAKLLLHYGTRAQKDHYLPRLARGDEVPCFALTGPEAGSDAASLPDCGVVTRGELQGREVLGIRLNWEKRYITLGPVATVLGLAFHLYDPDKLLGDTQDVGITLALIPTDTPGVEIGNRHFPMNHAFQNGPNRGRDVFIPLDWVIGGRDGLGDGWRMLMECLSDGRAISLPALSTGAGKLAARATGAYAAVRKQFKLPIGKFEGVADGLAPIAGDAYMMDAARTLTCAGLDMDEKPAVISAIVKYHLTERMRESVNHAMDIQGGRGICLGPRNYLGRIYQALPISITVEGANILTRNMIIFGQGALRSHPYVLTEMRAAMDADENRGTHDFDQTLIAHVRWAMSNVMRALWYGLTGARTAPAPRQDPAMATAYRQLTRMSTAFALSADMAMLTLGGSLKRRERLSARLGDALSYLYLASAALKRFRDDGQPEEDRPLVEWVWRESVYRIQESLLAFYANFPIPVIGYLLRHWIFPFGRSHRPPSDRLRDELAAIIMRPGQSRDRLTAGLYIPAHRDDPLGCLEDALARTVKAEPVLQRIREAMRAGRLERGDPESRLVAAVQAGVISDSEAAWVREAMLARREVIEVDEFEPDALTRRRPQSAPQRETG